METYEIIKKFRLENKLTQAQFGKILNCDRTRIADIERGKTAPNIDDIKAISKKFNVSSDYLLGLSDGKKIDDDAKAVCNYTGLNEETISFLHNLEDEKKEKDTKFLILQKELDEFHGKSADNYEEWKELFDESTSCEYAAYMIDKMETTLCNLITSEYFLNIINALSIAIDYSIDDFAKQNYCEIIDNLQISDEAKTSIKNSKYYAKSDYEDDIFLNKNKKSEHENDELDLALYKADKYLNKFVSSCAEIDNARLAKYLIDDIDFIVGEYEECANVIKSSKFDIEKIKSNLRTTKSIKSTDMAELIKMHKLLLTM